MTTVVINSHTYSDDSDPSTGLAAGGHRTRFIPALADVVVVAGTVASNAATTTANTATATTQAGIATTQAGIATTQASTATTQAGIATTQAGNASASAAAALISETNANIFSMGSLPTQTGNAGKALTTNGTLVAWSAPAPAAHTHLAADLPPSLVKSYFMAGW
ncbi:hypothetical protein [Candidatus Contendibacter odensensis]|uniref:Uncharacterized protein n=1 Tax=Candidatus Contendobacter odensis Run_B_J11 TaxID=1400861 RepID=A0A7U7G947_9GAMM|nr:hypothetical protein [Candidatus Contendobacter odensis]CDH43863.1 hypothetical protein BN874_1370028 [Candidatus Contendobacter odensis Run_B_J11]